MVEGDVVGYASLHDGFLTNSHVHPSYQRDGIGAALLTEVKKFASDGFKFWVFETNQDAIRFYERHGARTVRTTDGCLYQKLNSTIMVVKATDDRLRCDAAYVLDGTMDWSVFAKRPMGPQLVIISAILRQDSA